METTELRIRIGQNENIITPCFIDEDGNYLSRHFGTIQPSTIVEVMESDNDSWNSLNKLHDGVLMKHSFNYTYNTPLNPLEDIFKNGKDYWIQRHYEKSGKKFLMVAKFSKGSFYDEEYKIPSNEILAVFNIYQPNCEVNTTDAEFNIFLDEQTESFDDSEYKDVSPVNMDTYGIRIEEIGQ